MGPGPEAVDVRSAAGDAMLVATGRRGEGNDAAAGAPVFTAVWLDGRMLMAASEVDGAWPGADEGDICWLEVRRDRART